MKNIRKYKNSLIQERDRVLKQIKNMTDEESKNFKDSVGNLSNYDNHPGDIGSELYEREKDAGLKENNIELLEKIDNALKAIDENKYGYCQNCGNSINEERLEVLPYTPYCKKCSEDEEKQSNFGNEIYHTVSSNSSDDLEANRDEAWKEVEKYGTSSSGLEKYNPDDNPDDFED